MSGDQLTACVTEQAPMAPNVMRWSKVGTILSVSVIVLSGIAAYYRCMPYPFIFDDGESLIENPYINHLWPPTYLVSAPPQTSVAGRPFVSFTLAVNYFFGGLNPWGYRALNLAIHLLGGLALFGIIRRTLCSSRLRERYGQTATPLALATTLIWVLHPLQTESVTYIIQRCESLMGFFFLLTMYASIRAFQGNRPLGWKILAVVACLSGMATKESMAAAPLLVLLYDRVFVSDSFKRIFKEREHLRFHAALACTWILLGILVASGPRSDSAGFGVEGLTPLQYALSQPGVLVHYLSLTFWPDVLCLDYAWPLAQAAGEIVPPLLIILTLLAATIGTLFRRPPLGYLGAWFFLILAPTSSVIPILDLAFEHRMYLSLAAISVLVVLVLYSVINAVGRRFSSRHHAPATTTLILAFILAVLLGIRTFHRNEDYCSRFKMWNDVIAKSPNNPRANNNLALALKRERRFEEAIRFFRKALQLQPRNSMFLSNLTFCLIEKGDLAEATEKAEELMRRFPNLFQSYKCRGTLLALTERYEEAAECFLLAEKMMPDNADLQFKLAHALSKIGQDDKAIMHYTRALKLQPDNHETHYNLANLLLRLGFSDEATMHYVQAIQIKPDYVEAHFNLAGVLRNRGEIAEANRHLEAAYHAALSQGDFFASLELFTDAADAFRKATLANPNSAEAFYKLGCGLMQIGKWPEAVEALRQTLQLDADHVEAKKALTAAEAHEIYN